MNLGVSFQRTSNDFPGLQMNVAKSVHLIDSVCPENLMNCMVGSAERRRSRQERYRYNSEFASLAYMTQ